MPDNATTDVLDVASLDNKWVTIEWLDGHIQDCRVSRCYDDNKFPYITSDGRKFARHQVKRVRHCGVGYKY